MNGPIGPLKGPALAELPPLILSSSGPAVEAVLNKGAVAAIGLVVAERDRALEHLVEVAGNELKRSTTLRDRFNDYVHRSVMPSHTRLLALHFAARADIGTSGLLEMRDYTLCDLAEFLKLTFYRVSAAHGKKPGGLQQLGLIEVLSAGGEHRKWHSMLTIGADDADLPARKIEAYKARLRKSYTVAQA